MDEHVDDGSQLLLKLKDAADRLSISRAHLYRLLDACELTSVHIGRSRRIPVAALNEFVRQLGAPSAEPASDALGGRLSYDGRADV